VAPGGAGLASGLVNTVFMMGGALGLAVLASLAASRTGSLTASGHSHLAALVGGYHAAFLVGAAFAVAAAALGGAPLREQPHPAAPPPPPHPQAALPARARRPTQQTARRCAFSGSRSSSSESYHAESTGAPQDHTRAPAPRAQPVRHPRRRPVRARQLEQYEVSTGDAAAAAHDAAAAASSGV